MAGDNLNYKAYPWELVLSSKNGAWLSLKYKGKELLDNSKVRQTIELNAGKVKIDPKFVDQSFGEAAGVAVAELHQMADKEQNLRFKLVAHHFDRDKGILNLKYKSGKWMANETVTFGVNGRKNRIERKASFTSNAKIDLKFKTFHYLYYLPLKGNYLFPATFFYDNNWRQDNKPDYPSFDRNMRKGEVKRMKSSGNDRIKFSIIEPEDNLSLIFFVDSRLDNSVVRYRRNRNDLTVDCIFGARGWALPGVVHELAGAYLEAAECNPEEALRKNCPQILKDLGVVPPSGRPAWVPNAAIMGVATEPFYGEHLNDLAEIISPRMKQLHLNTAWYRPVEASTGRYCPIDYKVCEPKIGTWADYRNANAIMHKNNMRVLQDLVPHGGGQLGVLMRGQSAKVMTFTENGCVLNGWGCDFNQPDWRNYIESVANFLVGEQHTDGFRVDAIYGSKSSNWRKKGFPSQAPPVVSYAAQHVTKNSLRMLPALWKQTMKLENGELPALEYPRASLASSNGGLNMLASIRKGAKNANPQSALLLESGELPFTAVGDMHYDRDIQSCWFKLRTLSPEQFVEGLSLWLEEQKYVDAPGTIRMRYMETGLSESWPYRLWYGFEGDKAIRAMCYYIHGVPMVYEWFTQGEGTHLARLGLLRKKINALTHGDAFYRDVKSSDPRVFTVLRNTDKESVLGLINFSPCKLQTKLTIPSTMLKLPNAAEIAVYDAYSGTVIAKGNKAQISTITIKMRPFQNILLVWRNAKKTVPTWLTNEQFRSVAKRIAHDIKLQKNTAAWIVKSSTYTCRINAKTGLIDSFSSSKGEDELEMDILQEFGSKSKSCQLSNETGKNFLLVKSYVNKTVIIYTFKPECIDIQVNSMEDTETVISFNNAKRWQLDSFEGMLDDIMPEKLAVRRSFASNQHKRRVLRDRKLIWSSLECPLDWNRPELRVINDAGTGVTLNFKTPENPGHLYSSFNGKPGLYYFAGLDKKYPKLEFSISPEASIKNSIQGDECRIGKKLTLTNESYGWKIENKHYIIHILRHNGVISALYAKTPQGLRKILEKQDVIADKAMAKGSPYACALMDPDPKVLLFRDADGLHINFAGELRSAYKAGHSLNFYTDYFFNDSPEFSSTMKLCSTKGNPAVPGLTYKASVEPFSKYLRYKILPAADSGHARDMSRGRHMKLQFFDDFKNRLIPQKDYSYKLVIRTDGKEIASNTAPARSNILSLKEDPGFEKRSLKYSLGRNENVKFLSYEPDKRLCWKAEYNTRIMSGIGRKNSSGIYMSWPNPVFIQNLNPIRLRSGKYHLSFWLKGKIIEDNGIKKWSDKLVTVHPFLKDYTPFNASIEYYTKDGRKKTLTHKLKLSKIYDWKKYEFVFDIPESGYAPFVKITAMPEYAGEIYLDDLEWKKLK